ncbi:MAG: hypothetical protein OHK0046_06800 [Anaerolineae bacterium]
MKTFLRLCIAIPLLFMSTVLIAQDFPAADIISDEGGPVLLTGRVTYTNPFFTDGVSAPLIILEDQAGFVDRNEYFVFPPESQTLGQITSDFYNSPFTYSLALPIEPQGSLRDVDQDGEEDTGVMVFAVAYWSNTWGDPFLEARDLYGGGWSGAYASTRINGDTREVFGGKYLIYAPDDAQGFPSGFGDDRLLFTEDDPIVSVPQGYTVVNLDTEPFTFNRAARQSIDLIEPDGAALVDFSNLSFADAFDAMVEKFRTEYAFTEYKNLDWDALSTEFRPLFEKADEKQDPAVYLNALREFLWRVPDGHVNFSPQSAIIPTRNYAIAHGIGLGVRTTDDGRVLVTYVLENGPAAEAGVEVGAELVEIQGQDADDYISEVQPWDQPFSTPHNLRLAQERYALRFNRDTINVQIAFRNPGDQTESVQLAAVPEVESFTQSFESFPLTGFELPVEYEVLDNGFGYAAIYSFNDDEQLTIQLWERMIRTMKAANVPGLIIDMRFNGGGNGFLADQMTAYFFEESVSVGFRSNYNEETGEFSIDQRSEERLYLPPEELQYNQPVVVLSGPDCASACERFVYNFTLRESADVVAQYPTAGLGGGVNDFQMPLGVTIRFTVTRSLDGNQNIHIEGLGVAPTVDVPVNEETLFSDGDPILEYGIEALSNLLTMPSTPTGQGGTVRLGDTVTGAFVEGERVRYTFEIEGGTTFDIYVGSEDDLLTTVVRIYDQAGNVLLSNEDTQAADSGSSFLSGLSVRDDLTVILEIGTYNDSLEGDYILSITETTNE